MPRWVTKLLALFGTFVLPLVCTILPYKVSGYIVKRGASGRRLLSYLMCLGGGIFFGTYLLHMGPEVQTILKDSLLDPYGITYPLAELIAGVGFFVVLFAEKLVLRWNKRRVRHKRKQSPSAHAAATASEPVVTTAEVSLTRVIVSEDEQLPSNKVSCACSPSEEMCSECIEGKQCPRKAHEASSEASSQLLSPPRPASDTGCSNGTRVQPGGHLREAAVPHENVKDDVYSLVSHTGHHHATRSLILILALSLHRIFEGMSIGLQQTVASVVSLFGAVMCHEMVIGFSLGLQFVRSGFALQRLLITSVVCSSIMPLGVLIGLVMTEIESTSGHVDIANGVLQAIAMGTFIYVTFFEILQEEIDSEDTSLGKIICIAAGFALMAVLNLIPEGGNLTTASHAGAWNTTTVLPPFNATLPA